MTALLFYFIGNSDIQVNGQRISEDFRKKTEEILLEIKKEIEEKRPIIRDKGFKLQNKSIELPILYSYLDYLSNELNHLKIYLIYTAQKLLHEKDTLYAYEIIKLYLNNKYKKILIEEICIDKDPSDWDEMGKFFRRKVQELKSELDLNLNNYISISPGTPASYVSLALNLLDYDVKFIASHQEGESSSAKEISIYNIIKKENTLDKVLLLLNSYRYKNVADFIANSPLRYMKNFQDLVALLNYCINDDFFTALKKFKSLPPDMQSGFKEIGEFISLMCRNDTESKFKDLFWKIQIAEECAEFVELVALIFNMRENLLQHLFKKVTGKELMEFKELIDKDIVLKEEFNKSKLNYDKPSAPVIEKILSHYAKMSNQEKRNSIESLIKFSQFLNIKENIDGAKISLADLRNQGRFAHGIKATNLEILNCFGGAKQIIVRISELLKAIIRVDIDLDKNIYRQANKNITDYLKKEIKIID